MAVRPSGTEPKVKFYMLAYAPAESRNPAAPGRYSRGWKLSSRSAEVLRRAAGSPSLVPARPWRGGRGGAKVLRVLPRTLAELAVIAAAIRAAAAARESVAALWTAFVPPSSPDRTAVRPRPCNGHSHLGWVRISARGWALACRRSAQGQGDRGGARTAPLRQQLRFLDDRLDRGSPARRWATIRRSSGLMAEPAAHPR